MLDSIAGKLQKSLSLDDDGFSTTWDAGGFPPSNSSRHCYSIFLIQTVMATIRSCGSCGSKSVEAVFLCYARYSRDVPCWIYPRTQWE
ncbi:hypothetical protein BDN71DRAFT_348460 [Pleurotus eryngii]|uniref:Uncharacterized protein n=1 Tax=Pleurotus eryngii TaxID=5323 RepID=A0A9P6A423_PLEER|nr:hypothetical protein BDN71DRAFT_348460 [Pleurotus eryngii]